ncbi:hypothetical protein Ac2012v2_005846 [Leucoagaricus gongylophorus]
MPFPGILLADHNAVPSIAYGTGSVNKGNDIHEYIENALDQGFEHIDTAQFYRNEESVGIAIRQSGLSRSEIFVTTKWSGADTDIQRSLETSLAKLGLKYVNLFLIHHPSTTRGKLESVWRSFERLRDTGLTKSIGVSNFNIEELECLFKIARVKPVVNQIKFHPYNWAENKLLLEFHKKHGIVTEAYSSLSPITRYPGGPVDAALAKAAKRLNATPAQIIFLWIKAKGAVIVTTTSKCRRMKEYLTAGDLPDLTPEEVTAIDEAGLRGLPLALKLKHLLSAQSLRYWLLLFMLLSSVLYIIHQVGPQRKR